MSEIVALCDNVEKALQFRDELSKLDDATVLYLVCNNHGHDSTRFYLRQLIAPIRRDPRRILLLLRLLASRQLRICDIEINSPNGVALLDSIDPEIGVHGMGVIYDGQVIDAFEKGLLNPSHIGRLPDYRGRSVFEWTVLFGDEPAITCFALDEGIDTGEPIVHVEKIDVSVYNNLGDAKQAMFARSAPIARKSIEKLQQSYDFHPNNTNEGDRYYVMSDLMKRVATEIFDRQYTENDQNDTRQE